MTDHGPGTAPLDPRGNAEDLAHFVAASPSSYHAAVSYTHLTLPTTPYV